VRTDEAFANFWAALSHAETVLADAARTARQTQAVLDASRAIDADRGTVRPFSVASLLARRTQRREPREAAMSMSTDELRQRIVDELIAAHLIRWREPDVAAEYAEAAIPGALAFAAAQLEDAADRFGGDDPISVAVRFELSQRAHSLRASSATRPPDAHKR
jgi:hypothetical protein